MRHEMSIWPGKAKGDPHFSRSPNRLFLIFLPIILLIPTPSGATKAHGEGLPSLSVSDITLSQDACGAVNAVFTVSLSRLVDSKTVSVNYATADGLLALSCSGLGGSALRRSATAFTQWLENPLAFLNPHR